MAVVTRFRPKPLDFQSRDRNRIISLFAQGSFAVTDRLRLNAGLRWDGQYFKGLDNDLGTGITDQYQPRLGFVYQIGEFGTQKFSGSAARFYEQVPLQMISLRFGNLSQDFIRYDHNPLEDPSGGVVIPLTRPGAGITEPALQGEHFDEMTLGYERQIAAQYKLGIRGIYRTVREIIQNSNNPETGASQEILGNPGRGILSHMPRPQRDYAALELTLARFGGDRFNFFTSYVLSRTYGNYTGLFSSDTGLDLPNAGTQFDNPEQLVNATGPLPNDRTHVFKFNDAYRFDFGLDAGVAFTWQSGMPLNDVGAHPSDIFSYVFLQERGSVGRSPAIWDLNLRLTYHLSRLLESKLQSSVFVDILHAFSQREPVNFEQRHFFAVDPDTGEQITENPNYLRPVAFQPPMTVRLGVEVGL